MTNWSVSDIYAQITRNIFAKPYLYEVRILGSSASGFVGGGGVPDATPEVMLNCAAIDIPGINIGYTQDRRYGVGVNYVYPQSKGYTELNLTFYETEYQPERAFFVNWINKIYLKKVERFGYYKDFVKNISIIQYNRAGAKTYECLIKDCFPTNLSPLDKGYAAGDNIPQFNVNIQFNNIDEIFTLNGASPFTL